MLATSEPLSPARTLDRVRSATDTACRVPFAARNRRWSCRWRRTFAPSSSATTRKTTTLARPMTGARTSSAAEITASRAAMVRTAAQPIADAHRHDSYCGAADRSRASAASNTVTRYTDWA